VEKKKKLLHLLLKWLAKPQSLLVKLQSMLAKLLNKLLPLLLTLLLLLAKLLLLLAKLLLLLAKLLTLLLPLLLLPSNSWSRNERPAFGPVFLCLQETIKSHHRFDEPRQGLRVGKPQVTACVM
jgi:hypothetical protein